MGLSSFFGLSLENPMHYSFGVLTTHSSVPKTILYIRMSRHIKFLLFISAYEMLWCASQCGNLNGNSTPSSSSSSSSSGASSSGSSPDVISPPYLNFGDYSVFEMKRAYVPEVGEVVQTTTAPASKIPHKNNTDHNKLTSASEFINKCNGNFYLLDLNSK